MAIVVALLPGPAVLAATLHVPGDHPNIQAAVSAAQNGDTIVVADGTHAGNGNRFIGSGGKSITIRSENGAPSCTIDGQNSGPAFFLVADEPPDFVIDGFTITNGSDSSGGAFFIHHGSQALIRNCVLVGNSASQGGAVHCETNSAPTFLNCTITGNSATLGGGVSIVDFSNPTFLNCTISDNTASLDGGGIYNRTFLGSSVINGCVITGNTAGREGGGLFVGIGTPRFEHCTIADNDAAGNGDGLATQGPGNVALVNTILWANDGPTGEQIALLAGPNAENATVSISFCELQGGPDAVLVQPGSTLTVGSGNFDADPLFANLAAGDIHIDAGSPCVGAGDPAFLPTPGAVDIDGQPRIMGCRVDVGADEALGGFPNSGDLTADGLLSLADVDPFADALLKNSFPCHVADVNADGQSNGADVRDFVAALLGA